MRFVDVDKNTAGNGDEAEEIPRHCDTGAATRDSKIVHWKERNDDKTEKIQGTGMVEDILLLLFKPPCTKDPNADMDEYRCRYRYGSAGQQGDVLKCFAPFGGVGLCCYCRSISTGNSRSV